MSVIEPNKCKPLHDRILIEREEQEQKTAGGIIIPDTAKDKKPSIGKVIAVGNGVRDKDGQLVALDVKKGDRVLFAKWSGTELPGSDEKYVIIKESDILGIIEG